MHCDTNQFPVFSFCVPHSKPPGARGLSKHYHLGFDQKLGHGICAICRIPCACVACTSMLDQPCIYGIPSNKKARYQPVIDFTYWPVLGSYNNWNIIHLILKSTPFEAFEKIHQVVLDGISDNMASLVKSFKYDTINTSDTTTNGFYVIKFILEAYTLQKNTTINGKIISTGELVVKAQSHCSIQENNNCYWGQQLLQQTIIFPTRTIIHPSPDFFVITDVQEIPKTVCNGVQEKNPYKDILFV